MEENKTDWKSMLGLALIFAIVAFMLFRNQDETKEVEAAETTTEKTSEVATAPVIVTNDSIATPVQAQGQVIEFNNELIDFKINTKGALIDEALLKNYKTYDSLPVYLVKGGDHKFDLEFMTKDGRKLRTRDMVFTAQESMNGKNKVLSLTANPANGASIEFVMSCSLQIT